MPDNLVIVESPAKAKTIKKYLGGSFSVVASMGHMRDLPKSQFGVDVENNFEPKYITIRGKGELVSKLKKEAKMAKKVYLATDPDREGEAISWHLASLLNIDPQTSCRITFNEITKSAVSHAVKNPRPINQNLVDAQQARRVLDRIVGYKISPLLWKKVRKGLSAGRVQSVATRLIVDREREINVFEPKEYWTIDVKLTDDKSKNPFKAKFYGDAVKKITCDNGELAAKIVESCKEGQPFVKNVKQVERKNSPSPPFTTSTLQQEASKRLNFTAKRTMSAAQQLYEGVGIGARGQVALITYMRTDSTRISDTALTELRCFIAKQYGEEYTLKQSRIYKGKNNAQDAHEAIRPTDVSITPAQIKDYVSADLFKLYKLVWERYVACQMPNSLYLSTTVDVDIAGYIFKATGSLPKFDGHERVYKASKEDGDDQKKLPTLKVGDVLKAKEFIPKQHYTEPPSRYTEASLIKALEENGIGRPSTYAPTISTILARGYIVREKKALYATELGEKITELLEDFFDTIVDIEFTAALEEKLDNIEGGDIAWEKIIDEFYRPFSQALEIAEKEIGAVEIKDEVSDQPCDKCGRLMVFKTGKFGKFLACPGFPECRNAKNIVEETGANCTVCGGKILVRKSQKGRTYYACENVKECNKVYWDMPTNEKCEKCGELKVIKRTRKGEVSVCTNNACRVKDKKNG